MGSSFDWVQCITAPFKALAVWQSFAVTMLNGTTDWEDLLQSLPFRMLRMIPRIPLTFTEDEAEPGIGRHANWWAALAQPDFHSLSGEFRDSQGTHGSSWSPSLAGTALWHVTGAVRFMGHQRSHNSSADWCRRS